jgi:putative restriction endonuclease
MAFWWVNHKKTRKHEVRGGYLWSPFRNANRATNQSYENMSRARVGDVVFSYAHGRLGAVGRVTEAASVSPKPIEFENVGEYWSDEGWLVGVEFREVPNPIRPKDQIETIGPMLPIRNSPIQANGNGNQGCYLAGISDALGLLLLALLGADGIKSADSQTHYFDQPPDSTAIDDICQIEIDESIPETQRLQLAKARVGQGLFRKRVILLDGACRVTGVSDTRVLVASHIKPWRDASNNERVNGYNGILLSPHVDALFDEQLITFDDDGLMRVHESLPRDVLDRWSINPDKRVERFRPEQSTFLSHHRRLFSSKT